VPTVKPLSENDFPNVRFWHKSKWNNHIKTEAKGFSSTGPVGERGSGRASKGINVSMQYVEDENGDAVDGFRATAIRNLAQNVFQQLLNHGQAPATWSAAGNDVKKHYFHEMESQFTELRLCADHWKTQHLATHIYPSWHANRRNKSLSNPSSHTRVGPEHCQSDGEGVGASGQVAKRRSSETGSSNSLAKKAKQDTRRSIVARTPVEADVEEVERIQDCLVSLNSTSDMEVSRFRRYWRSRPLYQTIATTD
jgi:hypothetical protein